MRNHEQAEEVVQDVLMKVFRKIEMCRGDSAWSSWIYRITFNTAMSRRRRWRARRALEVTELEIGSVSDDRVNAHDPADGSHVGDEELLRRQLRERLVEAVDDLPAIYREPVVLRDLKGLTTEQASTRLRVKDQTLKSRLHRGRLRLRENLADFANGLSMRLVAGCYARSAVSKRTRSRVDSDGGTSVAMPAGCSVTGIIAERPATPSSRVTATSAAWTRGDLVSAVRISRVAAPASAYGPGGHSRARRASSRASCAALSTCVAQRPAMAVSSHGTMTF